LSQMHDGQVPMAEHPGFVRLERDKGRAVAAPVSVANDVSQPNMAVVDLECKGWRNLDSRTICKLARRDELRRFSLAADGSNER